MSPVIGYVVMPDHIHLVLLPKAREDLSAFLRDFKEFTAKRIVRQAEAESRAEWLAAFRRAGEATGRAIHKAWQDDNWATVVFSERAVRGKLVYMHNNPVRAGLVVDPRMYPYSSCRNCDLGDHSLLMVDATWGAGTDRHAPGAHDRAD